MRSNYLRAAITALFSFGAGPALAQQITISNGTAKYERGSIDTEKLDAILLERLQTVARELVRDGIKEAFSTESAALRLIIEDTVEGIKKLRGRQLANRVAVDALVMFVSLHEAEAMAREAVCAADGQLHPAATINAKLKQNALDLLNALNAYPKDGDPLKVTAIDQATYEAQIDAWWSSATDKAHNREAVICDKTALWPVLRNLKDDKGEMLQAQWLLIDAGFERTIRFFLESVPDDDRRFAHLAKESWGLGLGVVANTLRSQLEALAPQRTVDAIAKRVDFEELFPLEVTRGGKEGLKCAQAAHPTALFCKAFEADLASTPKEIADIFKDLAKQSFGSFLASLLGDERAKKLIEIYAFFMEFTDVKDNGDVEIDAESFLVSFYREFNARGPLRFYLSIGATGGRVYQYKAKEWTTPILYSEKIGLQIAWSPKVVGEHRAEWHSNLYVGGLLYALAVAATEGDDENNPYAASAIIGIDPVGVKLYQAIEINASVFTIAPFSGDQPWSWGGGVNLAVPLIDYLSGDAT